MLSPSHTRKTFHTGTGFDEQNSTTFNSVSNYNSKTGLMDRKRSHPYNFTGKMSPPYIPGIRLKGSGISLQVPNPPQNKMVYNQIAHPNRGLDPSFTQSNLYIRDPI